jgi:hypothetical protein
LGRAQAGEYSIVSSYIAAEAKYGSTEIPIFMLAKDGAVIADALLVTIASPVDLRLAWVMP